MTKNVSDEPPPVNAFLRCMDADGEVIAELPLPPGTDWTQLVQLAQPDSDTIAVIPVIEEGES